MDCQAADRPTSLGNGWKVNLDLLPMRTVKSLATVWCEDRARMLFCSNRGDRGPLESGGW